jgi:hypothetical protein
MIDLYKEFDRSPLWQKAILVSLITFLLGYFVLQILLSGLWQKYNMVKKETAGLQQKIAAAELLIKDLPLLHEKEKNLIPALSRAIPWETNLSTALKNISTRSGVTIIVLKIQAQDRYYFWTIEPCEIQLAGPLPACSIFLDRLSKSTLACSFQNIKLAKETKNRYILNGSFTFYFLNKQFKQKAAALAAEPALPILRGFWHQGDITKVFLDNTLLGINDVYKGYKIVKILESDGIVVILGTKTNRKYSLKVLKSDIK